MFALLALLVSTTLFAQAGGLDLVAVAANGNAPSAAVSSQAGRSPYFLLFDKQGAFVAAVDNPYKDAANAGIPAIDFLAGKGAKVVVAEGFGAKIAEDMKSEGPAAGRIQGCRQRCGARRPGAEMNAPAAPVQLASPAPLIRAEHLVKTYRAGEVEVPAVKGVDFTIERRIVRRLRRPLGQRQEHAAQHDRLPRPSDQRQADGARIPTSARSTVARPPTSAASTSASSSRTST